MISTMHVGAHVHIHLVERFADESALPAHVFLCVLEPAPANGLRGNHSPDIFPGQGQRSQQRTQAVSKHEDFFRVDKIVAL